MSCDSGCECKSFKDVVEEQSLLEAVTRTASMKVNGDEFEENSNLSNAYRSGVADGYTLFAKELVEVLKEDIEWK